MVFVGAKENKQNYGKGKEGIKYAKEGIKTAKTDARGTGQPIDGQAVRTAELGRGAGEGQEGIVGGRA